MTSGLTSAPERFEGLRRRIPLQRRAQPEEIAAVPGGACPPLRLGTAPRPRLHSLPLLRALRPLRCRGGSEAAHERGTVWPAEVTRRRRATPRAGPLTAVGALTSLAAMAAFSLATSDCLADSDNVPGVFHTRCVRQWRCVLVLAGEHKQIDPVNSRAPHPHHHCVFGKAFRNWSLLALKRGCQWITIQLGDCPTHRARSFGGEAAQPARARPECHHHSREAACVHAHLSVNTSCL